MYIFKRYFSVVRISLMYIQSMLIVSDVLCHACSVRLLVKHMSVMVWSKHAFFPLCMSSSHAHN